MLIVKLAVALILVGIVARIVVSKRIAVSIAAAMNRWWCLSPGLGSFDVDNLVIDLVLFFVHDEIYRRGIPKDDKGKAPRIARVPIPHDIDRCDRSELFKVELQGFFRCLPRQAADENLALVIVVRLVMIIVLVAFVLVLLLLLLLLRLMGSPTNIAIAAVTNLRRGVSTSGWPVVIRHGSTTAAEVFKRKLGMLYL